MKKHKITIQHSKYGGIEAELAQHAFWFVWWHIYTRRKNIDKFIAQCIKEYPNLMVIDKTKP